MEYSEVRVVIATMDGVTLRHLVVEAETVNDSVNDLVSQIGELLENNFDTEEN